MLPCAADGMSKAPGISSAISRRRRSKAARRRRDTFRHLALPAAFTSSPPTHDVAVRNNFVVGQHLVRPVAARDSLDEHPRSLRRGQAPVRCHGGRPALVFVVV